VFQGALKSVDENSIAGMKGVHGVVRMPNAVAIVADSWWRAKCAADALRVTWDDCGHGALSTAAIVDYVRGGLDAPDAQVGRAYGDAAAALASAARRIDADYAVPFLAHATMEPQTCTAHVTENGVEIWAPNPRSGNRNGNGSSRRSIQGMSSIHCRWRCRFRALSFTR
jgi:isoquinoline 1-oxidoreductase subunit beta